jgi:signal transduction histidine kinase
VHTLGRLVSASFAQRRSRWRVAAWLLALLGPPLLTIAVLPLRGDVGLAGFLLFTLLLVTAVAVLGGVWPALVTVGLGFLAGAIFFARPYDSLSIQPRLHNVPLIAYLVVGAVLGILVDDLAALAQEQAALRRVEAALRRVATLVARAVPADELFAASTEEVARLLGVDHSALTRIEADGTATVLAEWTENGQPSAAGAVLAHTESGATVSTPIIVEARQWGFMTAGSSLGRPLPADSESRLKRFTELLGTAIANAQARDELTASRARIVAAADQTRRGIERDLHDGAQQRLVSLTLELRTAQMSVPAELSELQRQLAQVADGLGSVMEELREMARGIHPAILAEGGVGPALRTLVRRSPIPVELQVDAAGRLPEPVEVAVYYLVAESLTNIVKHARASLARVVVSSGDGVLRVSIEDDGAGGAEPSRGTGLTGLLDRVQALGGTITVASPPGDGTHVRAELPIGSDAGRITG